MQISRRKVFSGLMSVLGIFSKPLFANEQQPDLTRSSSVDEFTERLREAESLVNFFYLMNTKETQVNDGFCGPTSVSMAINSLPNIDRSKLVRCSDIWGKPESQFRKAFVFEHKKYKSLSQYTWFIDSVSKIKPADEVSKSGYTLAELHRALVAFDASLDLGLTSSLYYADQLSVGEFRQLARDALASDNQRIIVNYDRSAVDQPGGGHLSCLAGFHEPSDSFLVYDTASAYKAREKQLTPMWSEWIPVGFLHTAMLRIDGSLSRGCLVLSNHIG